MTQTECLSCGENVQYLEDRIRGRLSCPTCGETIRDFPDTIPAQKSAAKQPGDRSLEEPEIDFLAVFRVLMAGATAGVFIALPLSFLLDAEYSKTLTMTAPITAILLVILGLGLQTTRGATHGVFRAIQVVFVTILIISVLVVVGLKIYVEAKRTTSSPRHSAPTWRPSQPSPISGR